MYSIVMCEYEVWKITKQKEICFLGRMSHNACTENIKKKLVLKEAQSLQCLVNKVRKDRQVFFFWLFGERRDSGRSSNQRKGSRGSWREMAKEGRPWLHNANVAKKKMKK